jgi:hypothetical protein
MESLSAVSQRHARAFFAQNVLEAPTKFRRRAVKFGAERLCKMRVAGKAQIKREHREVGFAIEEMLQRKA